MKTENGQTKQALRILRKETKKEREGGTKIARKKN